MDPFTPPPRDIRKVIGDNIHRIRIASDWTQEQLAAKLDVSTEYVCRLEKGIAYPSVRLLEEMAALMDREVQEFLS